MNIEQRRLRFKIAKDISRYWNDNCPVKTHIFNAIAILAPAFERLAITSVLPYQNQITSRELSKALKGFIGQESAHGSEFIRFNQILKGQGYDVKKQERRNLKQFKWLANKFSPKMHLSLTLAAEHLTAIISDLILREPEWFSHADVACAALWRWHAIEEIEHKAVAFDVYRAIGGGYFVRLLGMTMISGMMMNLLVRNFFYLVRKDKLLLRLSFWKTLVSVLFCKKGFLRKLIVPWLCYVKPFFHPWQKDNESLIMKWKKQFARAKNQDELIKIFEAH